MMTHKCPECDSTLDKVTQDSGSLLNQYQFDAFKAGDYYCDSCPPNTSARSGYRYFWEADLQEHKHKSGTEEVG